MQGSALSSLWNRGRRCCTWQGGGAGGRRVGGEGRGWGGIRGGRVCEGGGGGGRAGGGGQWRVVWVGN